MHRLVPAYRQRAENVASCDKHFCATIPCLFLYFCAWHHDSNANFGGATRTQLIRKKSPIFKSDFSNFQIVERPQSLLAGIIMPLFVQFL